MNREERGMMAEPSNDCVKMEYIPSRNELLGDYEIRLRFLTIGCVIEVGCKSIPFTTIKEGMKQLNAYIEDPYNTRKIWEEKFNKGE